LPDEAHAVFQLNVGTDDAIRADLDAVPARAPSATRAFINNRHVLTDPTGLVLTLSTLCVARKTQRDWGDKVFADARHGWVGSLYAPVFDVGVVFAADRHSFFLPVERGVFRLQV
jgi:hypothetical protein